MVDKADEDRLRRQLNDYKPVLARFRKAWERVDETGGQNPRAVRELDKAHTAWKSAHEDLARWVKSFERNHRDVDQAYLDRIKEEVGVDIPLDTPANYRKLMPRRPGKWDKDSGALNLAREVAARYQLL